MQKAYQGIDVDNLKNCRRRGRGTRLEPRRATRGNGPTAGENLSRDTFREDYETLHSTFGIELCLWQHSGGFIFLELSGSEVEKRERERETRYFVDSGWTLLCWPTLACSWVVTKKYE